MAISSSMVAPEVVIMEPYNAANDDKKFVHKNARLQKPSEGHWLNMDFTRKYRSGV